MTPEIMKNVIITLTCLFCTFPAFSQSYSTNFSVAENPISEGGKWVNGKSIGLDWNDVQTVPGKAYGAHLIDGPRYADCIAHLNTSFEADQYAQGTVSRVPGYRNPSDAHEIELLLRFRITANNTRGYEVLWAQDGGIAIVRWNGYLGDYTSLLEGPNIGVAVDGDVLRAEITGSVIKVYKNGSLVATGPSNSTWTDGQPGMGFWPLPGAILASYGWKNYQAGSMATGAVLKPELSEYAKPGFASDTKINRYDLQGRMLFAAPKELSSGSIRMNFSASQGIAHYRIYTQSF
jgi:hypothetical protein